MLALATVLRQARFRQVAKISRSRRPCPPRGWIHGRPTRPCCCSSFHRPGGRCTRALRALAWPMAWRRCVLSLPPDRAEGAARPGRATGTARSARPGLGVWGAGSQRPLTHSPCPAQRSTAGPCRLPPGGHGGVLSLDASGRARPAARIGMRGRRVILTAAATGEGKTGAADNEKEGWLAG